MLLPLLFALAQSQKGAGPELTSGRPMPPEQACYDVKVYELNGRVDPQAHSIQGRMLVMAKPLKASDDIVLDLDSRLKVDQVLVRFDIPDAKDRAVDFTHKDGEIRIHAPRTFGDSVFGNGTEFVVTVLYGGVPREAPRPPWDGGFVWSKTKSGAPWIATCNQMQGGDLWWPCKDQPDDEADEVEINVTVPNPLVDASNGRLNGIEKDMDAVTMKAMPGWNTYRWRVSTPINTYGIALNIAPYETITRDYKSVAGDTFPVTYWVLPENLEKGKILFEDILRQMAFYESIFGPYPFRADKYGVAETPHLGMEHQSIIAYGNNYKMDRWGEDRGYDELHLHEFAHEWWANLVTCANWNDFWIHESFASYAQALYAEHVGGEKAYFTEMKEQKSFLNRAAIAPREKKSTAEMYFGDREGSPGGDIYSKGAWVLHTLRWLLGDEKFFASLRRMAYPDPEKEKTKDGSACRFATTDEIVAIAEKTSGVPLAWFFEVYVRQPKLPVLSSRLDGDALVLEWTSPTGAPFPMPVEVALGGEFVRVPCPDGKGRLELHEKRDYQVDPRERVLREGLVHR
jgi:aminopeptidase N